MAMEISTTNGSFAEVRMRDLGAWPCYDAAVLGLKNYWYPLTFSRRVTSKPLSLKLLGEPVMLRREASRIYALRDQCMHRGVPLSLGRQEFPGTWTCCYHGWTYDLNSGVVCAALTDGPDSPICGKVQVRTFPVEERAGVVWVWMGDGPPTVPVDADIPEEMLAPNAVIEGRITERKGNWRLAAENGYDEAHAKYLHRYGAWKTLFIRMPGWASTTHGGEMKGPWLERIPDRLGAQGEYPGLGTWPRWRPWQRPRQGKAAPTPGTVLSGVTAIRLPTTLRVTFPTQWHFAWYEPVDENHHRYFQFLVKHTSGLAAFWFHLKYWLYERWAFHVQFNNQDARIVELMPMTGPERLFRPDASITAWRRLCEHARGFAEPGGEGTEIPAENGSESREETSVPAQPRAEAVR